MLFSVSSKAPITRAKLPPVIKSTFKGEEIKTVQLHASAPKVCTKKDVGNDQNQYVKIAGEVSNNDIDFLALLESENGLWSVDRKSNLVGANGYRDRGFCQINPGWHPEIFNDKRFFEPRWQIEQCYKLYKGGTRFWAAKNIPLNRDKFVCQ